MAGGKIDILVEPDLKKFPGQMESGLRGASGAAESSGKSLGSRISSGISTTLKRSVTGVGVATGGLIAGSIAKGMGRLVSIDTAEAKLEGLGHTTESTAAVMDSALASVTGTAYGLGDAATIAAGAVAAGVKPGQDLTRYLTMTADAAAIAGADLSEMGSILNQVQTGQVAYTDNLNQLADRGIPIYQWLGEEAGVAAEEVKGLAAEGEISSEMFFSAIEKNIGGAAQALGDSFTGAVANFGAALGRAGATSVEPFFGLMADGLGVATSAVDDFEARIAPMADNLGTWLTGTAVPAVQDFVSSVQGIADIPEVSATLSATQGAISAVVDAGRELAPVALDIGGSLAQAAASLGISSWTTFVSVLGGAASVVGALAGPLEVVSDFLAEHPGLVTAGVAAWAGAKTIPNILKRVDGAISPARKGIRGFGEDIRKNQKFIQQMGVDVNLAGAALFTLEERVPAVARMTDAFRDASGPARTYATRQRDLADSARTASIESRSLWESVDLAVGSMGRGAVSKVADFGGTVQGVLAAGLSGAKSAAGGLINALGGPWSLAITGATMAVSGIVTAIDRTERSTRLMRELGTVSQETAEQMYAAMSVGDLEAEVQAVTDGIDSMISKYEELGAAEPGFWDEIVAWYRDIDWSDLWDFGFNDNRGEHQQALDAQREMAEEAQNVVDYLAEVGITADEAGQAVAGSVDQYNELIRQLDTTTEEGAAAANALREQREEYLRMQEITESLAPGSVELSEALATIGDEAASSEDKVSALSDALDQMLGIDPTAEEAVAGLHEEIDQVTEAAKEALDQTKGWGEGLFGADGGLDLAQENARNLRETLMGMRDSLEDVVIAGEDVDAAFESQQPVLDALAEQYGISKDRVRELAAEMGLVPPLIKATVEVTTNEALAGLQEVFGAIQENRLEAGVPLDIPVTNVHESKAAIEDLGWTVETLHRDADGAGAIQVTADTDEAIQDVHDFIFAMGSIDQEKGITFHSNSPEEIEKIQGLGVEIETLGDGEYRIDSNTPEEIQHLLDLDLLLVDPKTGQVTVNSNLAEVLEKGRELDSRDGKNTSESHTVTRYEKYVRDMEYVQSAGGTQPLTGWMADGAVRYAADGLLSAQEPQIARGGSWLVWAEDETEGESFIPHARSKRERSTQILAETAGIFGLGLVDADGNPISRDGSNLDQKDPTHLADGATRRAGASTSGSSSGGRESSAPGAVPAGASDALSLVDTIGGAIDGLPDETVTTVTVEAAGVGEELTAISEQLAPLDEGETITVDAVGEPALQVLQAVGLETERLPDGAVEITASDAAAVDSLDSVSGMLVELGDTEVSPVALLDTDELEVSADDAQRLVEDLDIQEPTPTAQIIIDDLLAGKGIAQGELDFLHAMSPTPQADLNHALLDQGVAFSEGELQRVGNSKATSVVDAHNQSALTNIDNVMAALNDMPVERVIKIVAAGSAASALQGRATGGRIPRRATGGRLPTTGPGTDRTDAILGVGSDGVPTSWVDAGEWVINGARSDKFDRTLGAINAGSEEQIIAALRAELPSLQALAGGGKVGVVSPDQLLSFADGQPVMDQQAARSLQGAIYQWGGVNWGDCSGAMAGLARFATGLAAFNGRFATGNQEEALSALGFISGLGPSATSFNLGWYNDNSAWGGHTAGTIAGTNVEMGGIGGNGKIGGAAAGAAHQQFKQHAHLPLGELWAFDYFQPLPRVTASYQSSPDPNYQTEGGQGVGAGGMGVQIAQGLGGGVDYTSTEGVHLRSGAVVPWDTAGLYDTGGLWPSGTIGVNLSGRNERVLTGAQNDLYEGAMDGFPALVAAMEDAAGKLGGAAHELERAAFGLETTGESLEYFLGRGGAHQLMGAVDLSNFGGDWVREAEIVKDAEAGLADTRATIAGELDDITAAEDDLAAAQERLAEARASSGEVSVATSRRVEDAEQDVAKARADGDPEKVADAEQKLARAREDAAQDISEAEEKQAEDIQRALDDVEQAEAGLTEARGVAEDQAQRLEQAEREVIAARLQAVADLSTQAGEALSTAFSGVSDLFGVLADQARIMEETEQRLAAERVQRQTAELELQRAALNTVIAEQDIARTRAMGAVAVADAEAALEAARGAAALKGQTGIDAMSQALDRARVTGEFAVEEVAQSVIDNAAEVRAAQHAVDQARAQAALDELTSVHTQRMAVLDLAQATLTQQQAVALVDISTRQLAAQAAQLGGLTSQGAQRASSGWGGLAQAGGGLGKLVGGLLGGAAGFAVGGIPGALLGGGAGVVSGLFDILSGGRQAWKNREEISDSWQGMDTMDKIITGGGLLLGGGAAIGGAYASNEYGYGPEFAGLAAELGAQIASQSAGYAAGAITSDLERINSLADEERSLLELHLMQEQARLDQARMQAELDYLAESTALQADVEIAELLGRIAQADTTPQADALAEAAIVAAERRDQMLDLMSRQIDIAESLKNRPRQSITVQIPADGYVPTSTFESFIDTMARIQDEVEITKDNISGADYLAART